MEKVEFEKKCENLDEKIKTKIEDLSDILTDEERDTLFQMISKEKDEEETLTNTEETLCTIISSLAVFNVTYFMNMFCNETLYRFDSKRDLLSHRIGRGITSSIITNFAAKKIMEYVDIEVKDIFKSVKKFKKILEKNKREKKYTNVAQEG